MLIFLFFLWCVLVCQNVIITFIIQNGLFSLFGLTDRILSGQANLHCLRYKTGALSYKRLM